MCVTIVSARYTPKMTNNSTNEHDENLGALMFRQAMARMMLSAALTEAAHQWLT